MPAFGRAARSPFGLSLAAVDPDGNTLFISGKAELAGLAIAEVNPAYTSQNCSRCGLRGKRKRHNTFTCPHCGYTEHADVNASYNIRNRFTAFRSSGLMSSSPEAQS